MSKSQYKPDCGYAWIVVLACFMINFIMAGLARASGVMYIALIDTFAISREVATTPFSLRFCVRCMEGPIVGALGQHFGIRPIVMLGAIVSGIGGIVCSVAPNVTYITVGWGILHGLGYGMCNVIHVVVLSRYFDKYRGIALGISLTGDCFGTFLLPILLEYLLLIYDLKGVFLILAGISLNVLPAAMLLKPPLWDDPEISKQNPEDIRKLSVPNNLPDKLGIENKAFIHDTGTNVEIYYNNRSKHLSQEIYPEGSPDRENALLPPFSFNSGTIDLQEIVKQPRIMSIPNFCQNYGPFNTTRNNSCYSLPNELNLKRISSLGECNNIFENVCNAQDNPVPEMNRRNSQISILSSLSLEKPTIDALCKSITKDIVYPSISILQRYPENVSEGAEKNCDNLLSSDNFTIENKSQEISPNHNMHDSSICIEKEKDHLNQNTWNHCGIKNKYILDTENVHVQEPSAVYQLLMTNIKPIFLLMCATFALYVFLFIAVFTIIIDYAADYGTPTEIGKYLLVSFSVTDLFGRIGFGIVLDKNWISMGHYAGLVTSLMGLFIFIIPFCRSFIFWMVSFSLCGFIQGGSAIMYPILIQHYMDKKEEPFALGCLNFYGGLLMFPIPPMIGYFRDVVGSYDGVFWTTGGLCLFVGCLWVLEPLLTKKNVPTEKCTALNNKMENKVHI